MALGCQDYDELLALSVREPAAYWAGVLGFLGVAWAEPWKRYVDLDDGPEFPRWFPGGRINWSDTVFRHAASADGASRDAIVTEAENGTVTRLSYSDLAMLVRHLATGFTRLGVAKGTRVGLLLAPGAAAAASYVALSYIGAIAVPLFTGFGADAIISRLAACDAELLIASAYSRRRGRVIDIVPLLAVVQAHLPALRHVVMDGMDADLCARNGRGWLTWQGLAETDDSHCPPPMRTGPDDPFMVIYTSGTTGRPKGAVHTHGGFPLKIAHDAAVHFDLMAGDRWLWPADMGWVVGPITVLGGLMRGATLVCYGGAPDYPDPSRLARLVERHGVTHLGASPTLLRSLAASGAAIPAACDLSSLRLLITAGEVIDPGAFRWFHHAFGEGRCPVINYTGGTEVSGALLASVPVRPIDPVVFNSASPGVAVAVLDDAGTPLTGQAGELVILQPFVGMTQSFWEDRERYLDSYWRRFEGVWAHGDFAMAHRPGGPFELIGRSDDTLKVAGKRVGPAEIEDAALRSPHVAEAAAIGIQDAVKGQAVVVFVVAWSGAPPDDALAVEVTTAVQNGLGKPFRPTRVHVVSQLPRTRNGKLMRRTIRDAYDGRLLGDAASEHALAIQAIGTAGQARAIE